VAAWYTPALPLAELKIEDLKNGNLEWRIIERKMRSIS
jgi:hypothetical protein